MPKFAANLSMMYQEHPFLDRFAAASRDGFKAVEFLFPYAHAAADIKARLAEHGLALALEYAHALGNDRLHVMAGLIKPDEDGARHRAVYVRNLAYAAGHAKSA